MSGQFMWRWVFLAAACILVISAPFAYVGTSSPTAPTVVSSYAYDISPNSSDVTLGIGVSASLAQPSPVAPQGKTLAPPAVFVAADTAGTTAADLATACANSFTGDTPVTMADGSTKPIKDVKVGDRVIATDPQTGQTKAEPVVALIRHSGQHSMVLVALADGSVLDATSGHKIWDATQRTFVDAGQLQVGDRIETDTGALITISGLKTYDADLTAYNLQIGQIHTYYAGTAPVLVHNSCSDGAWDIAMKSFEKHGADLGFKTVDDMAAHIDSVMNASKGVLRDDGTRFWVDRSNSTIIFRGPNAGVPGSFYRPDNFAKAVADNMARSVSGP